MYTPNNHETLESFLANKPEVSDERGDTLELPLTADLTLKFRKVLSYEGGQLQAELRWSYTDPTPGSRGKEQQGSVDLTDKAGVNKTLMEVARLDSCIASVIRIDLPGRRVKR